MNEPDRRADDADRREHARDVEPVPESGRTPGLIGRIIDLLRRHRRRRMLRKRDPFLYK